jgi:hypothetical protein
MTAGIELSVEDAKLLTLAKGARARAAGSQGAAVRDDDGRTYAAASVALPSLKLTALQAAVAIAVSSGATALEAAVIVGAREGVTADVASVAAATEMSTPVLFLADSSGTVLERIQL